VRALEAHFLALRTEEAVAALAERRVPASEIRHLEQLFDDEQVRANGLMQTVDQPSVGSVRLLGSVVKVDGMPASPSRPAPGLNEHARELLEDS
jgi:crotonobetainyl-CoA:carnitine CoA-transferase CaiB-like acyl-CoA transferase